MVTVEQIRFKSHRDLDHRRTTKCTYFEINFLSVFSDKLHLFYQIMQTVYEFFSVGMIQVAVILYIPGQNLVIKINQFGVKIFQRTTFFRIQPETLRITCIAGSESFDNKISQYNEDAKNDDTNCIVIAA